MSALEDALTIPRAALALIPPPETPPSALLAGAFNLSFSPSLIAAPSPSSIWSNESQNFNIQLLLKVELFSVEFYRDLELSASEAWDNGARSLANLHPNIRLPIWYIPFAAKLVADDLDIDLNLDPEELALAAVSGRDRGPGKRVVKPRRLYEMDGNDQKVGKASIRAQSARLSKAGGKK